MSDNNATIYLRMLNLLSAIRELDPFSQLSADEEQFLWELMQQWHHKERVLVGDVINRSDRVPSSTAHRRLVALKGKGFLELRQCDDDKRVRYVQPTPLALSYIKHLNQGIGKLMRSDASA